METEFPAASHGASAQIVQIVAVQAVRELVEGYVSKMEKLVSNALDARRLTSAGAAAGGFLSARDGGHGPGPGNVGSTAKLAELLWQNLTEVRAPAHTHPLCAVRTGSDSVQEHRQIFLQCLFNRELKVQRPLKKYILFRLWYQCLEQSTLWHIPWLWAMVEFAHERFHAQDILCHGRLLMRCTARRWRCGTCSASWPRSATPCRTRCFWTRWSPLAPTPLWSTSGVPPIVKWSHTLQACWAWCTSCMSAIGLEPELPLCQSCSGKAGLQPHLNSADLTCKAPAELWDQPYALMRKLCGGQLFAPENHPQSRVMTELDAQGADDGSAAASTCRCPAQSLYSLLTC